MNTASRTGSQTSEQLIQSYDRIIELARESLDRMKKEGRPAIQTIIDSATDKAVELGDMTREEAQKIGEYVIRDLHDVADYLVKQKRELSEWLGIGLEKVEKRMVDKFAPVIEQAKLELTHLAKTTAKISEWHTGEIRGIGTLKCGNCGQLMHFNKTSRIPPCPKCHGTLFKRISG